MVKDIMLPKIAKVVVDLPVEGSFDYSIPKEYQKQVTIGQRAVILFNRRKMVGVIVDLRQTSRFKRLNPLLSLLDEVPAIDTQALQLTQQLSQQYGCSWGEAIFISLPPVLRRNTRTQLSLSKIEYSPLEKPQSIFLHDINKEKKWDFLRQKVHETLRLGQGVLILVHELTAAEEVSKRLGQTNVMILKKKLSVKQELAQWMQFKSGESLVAIGTRSAVFAPVAHLGFIVIFDEEHDFYKEEQSPYYDARYVAQMRAKLQGCSLCLVSAAPLAETWKEVQKKGWEKVSFEPDSLSVVQVVDMSNYNPQKTSIISFPLQNQIQKFLEAKKKVVLFMNRRGFAALTRCNQCGFTLRCERCDVNLTYLHSKQILVCRHCDSSRELPKVCPHCQGNYLKSMGKGIEKLEQEVAQMYPAAKVACYDRDNPTFPARADIILTTQTILSVKEKISFDFIAILNFDAELHHMNYRCAQKAFTLLVHLRQMAKEKLMVQTYMRDNYVLKSVQAMNYEKFYRKELQLRKELNFPPYQHLVILKMRGDKEEDVFARSQAVFEALDQKKPEGVRVTDAHPDVKPKVRDKYRFSILLKGKSVKVILGFVKKVLKGVKKKRGIIVTVEVDY